VTRRHYGQVLLRLHELHAAACGAIDASLGTLAHGELNAADLVAALRRDLSLLGCCPPEHPGASLRLRCEAEALGAWYVMEGAALGGAVIARHLRQCLGDDLPLAHFAGRGDGRWLRFLRHLDASLVDECAVDRASAGARRTYELSEELLAAG
jgi:heme oxygenase